MKIILNGANGRMGRAITDLVAELSDAEIVFKADVDAPIENAPHDADVIVDFSLPSSLPSLLKFAKSAKTPLVLATTGYSEEQLNQIQSAGNEVAILQSATMSIGINILMDLAAKVTQILQNDFDVEIIEKHHNKKLDAPSGVALAIANRVADAKNSESEFVYCREEVRKERDLKEIGIHSVRGGSIIGDHSVMFAGMDEVLEIKHHAGSRKIFAAGAIRAARFMVGKAKGLYSMKDVLVLD